MKVRRSTNSIALLGQRSNSGRCLLLIFLLLILYICGAIYAFLANEVTKVDVSGPDPSGPVIVPENYQNLLVLDVTIPSFDAGRIGEDVLLHNGILGSYPRDVLHTFDPTDWYADHDGDASFDGNRVSGNTEAIVSSNDDILDFGDTVRKTGLCLIESFDYSAGMGEQYIDSNHSASFSSSEAVVRTSTSAGEIHPGEVVRSGAADMTPFPSNIRFTDGINGNDTPTQYHDGEAIILDAEPVGILSDADAVLTPGTADLRAFPNVAYSDSDNDGEYASGEAVIADGGTQGQLDVGLLDGTGPDVVIRSGSADLKPFTVEQFIDNNENGIYDDGECIIRDGVIAGKVEPGDIEKPGLALLQPFSGAGYLFTDDSAVLTPDGTYTGDVNLADGYQGEAIFSDIDADGLIDNGELVTAGYAALKLFPTPATVWFIDEGNNICDSDEAVIISDDDWLSGSDTILRSGPAFLTDFDTGDNVQWADMDGDNRYDDGEELLVKSPDNILSLGEVIKPGRCGLESFADVYAGQVYSDNDGSITYSSGELIISNTDKILDNNDLVTEPGTACLILLQNSTTQFIDKDGDRDFDPEEAIVYDRNGDQMLDDGDGVARSPSGAVDIKGFGDEIVYIDHNSDEYFQGDSDNDVNWNDSDDTTWANDPDVTIDEDEVVLKDSQNHLALDSTDIVLRPGLALLTDFPETHKYTDDGDGGYDGYEDGEPNEAIIRDNNGNSLLDDTDEVIVIGRIGGAAIRDFDNTHATTAERFIDNNHDGTYTAEEAIWRDLDNDGLLSPDDEIVMSGHAALIPMRDHDPNVRYLAVGGSDGFNGDEAIIIDSDPIGVLNSTSEIFRAGMADMKAFDLPGHYEQYIDCNGDGRYTDGEPIVYHNPSLPPGLLGSTVLNPGALVLVDFPSNITFIDADRSESLLLNIESGVQDIINELDAGILDGLQREFENSGISLPSNAAVFPVVIGKRWLVIEEIYEDGEVTDYTVWYTVREEDDDLNIHSKSYSAIPEAIIKDGGMPWRLDVGNLDETGIDQVIVPGAADMKDIEGYGPANAYIDSNHNGYPDNGEPLVTNNHPKDILDDSDVVCGKIDNSSSGNWSAVAAMAEKTNIHAFQPRERFLANDVDSAYEAQPVVRDIGTEDNAWDASDKILYGGVDTAWSLTLQWGIAKYIDGDHDDHYTMDECILDSSDAVLDDTDTIVTPGTAGIEEFPDQVRFTDDERANGFFDPDEAIVNSDDNVIDPGEVIILGRADTVGEDRNRDGMVDPGEDLDGDNSVVGSSYPALPSPAADHKGYIYASETMPGPVCPLRYIDANNDGAFAADEVIIRDGGSDGLPNGLLDAGALDGIGTDYVLIPGEANLRSFARAEKFVDGNRSGTYDVGEAIVYDWYDSATSEGEFILAGDPALPTPHGSLAYQPPGSRTRDSVLLASDPDRAAMMELSDRQERKYIDRNHSGSYDGFYSYSGLYEPILWSVNDQLEEGNLNDDGTGADHVLAAGYASMRRWTGKAENLAWTDSDHDGEYQSNEAIVYDAGGDGVIASIGTGTGDDQIIVPGEADLSDFTNMKYVDADGSGGFDPGELIVDDSNPTDDMVQNDEIVEPGPVPSLQSFAPASANYRYCDAHPNNGGFDSQEAIVYTPTSPDTLETGDVVVAAGYAGFTAFADDPLNMLADYDHDSIYDENEAIIYGDGDQVFEASDQVIIPGAATSFDGRSFKYAASTAGAPYTDGCLIANDDGDNMLAGDEIVTSGTALLQDFNAATDRYADHNHNGQYDFATGFGEAIIIDSAGTDTDPDVVEIGDKIETAGYANLQALDGAGYKYSDANHNDMYDAGEAVTVEAYGDDVDDILEDSDIVLVAGEADIEQFASNFKFLDDEANSGAYERGEAIADDSNGNNSLDPGEIVTGGRAALRKFAGGEKYTDGGAGANARNSQYDQDEAVIRDGNSNGELDAGPLNGAGNDEVLAAGKAGLTHFDTNERYVDKNNNGEYDGVQGSEDIYLDKDNNGIVTAGDDALEYFVVENSGTATNSDLAAVELWADRDIDGQFEPDTHDAPAVISLIPDASNPKIWYEGPATAPPLPAPSSRASIDYTMPTTQQRFFVTVDISGAPTDGRDIQMGLPLNGVKTLFGLPGPSDAVITNTYAQKIDFADPGVAEITSPSANAVVYGPIALRAEVSDTVQVGKVEFYNGPPGEGNTPIAIDSDGNPWEASWDSSTVECGFYTLYARVASTLYMRGYMIGHI